MQSEDLTFRSIFTTFEDNSGYAIFKTAVDNVPDVLGYLRRLNNHSPVTPDGRISRQRETFTRSGLRRSIGKSSYGTSARITLRPETAPDSSPVVIKSRSITPACRFQFRHEVTVPMTPGPQSYQVITPTKPLLGIISREPKYKERNSMDLQTIGPGAYEIDYSGTGGGRGFRFGKELIDEIPSPEALPGPGHYQPTEITTNAGYSISKAQALQVTTISQRLGPGCYNVSPSKSESHSGRFSSAPRFPTQSALADYTPRYRVLTKEEKDAQKRRIEANKVLAAFTKTNRNALLLKRGAINSIKMEVTKIAKTSLMESIKHRRKLALEDKFRRFEWRQNKEEVLEVSKSWLAGVLCVSWLSSSHRKFTNRKELHLRSRYALLFLTVISISLGVIMRKVRRIRVARSKKVIARLLIPGAKHWIQNKANHYKALVVNLTEMALTQDVIFQLMVRWLGKLYKVQATIRRFLIRRKLMYVQAKMGWAMTEISLRKNTKSRTFSTEVFEKSSIPDRIKEHYIRVCIQKKAIAYFNELAKYREMCVQVMRRHDARRCDREAELVLKGVVGETEEELELPSPPTLFLGLTKDDFKTMIVEAEKNRLNWDKIVSGNPGIDKRKSLKSEERRRTK